MQKGNHADAEAFCGHQTSGASSVGIVDCLCGYIDVGTAATSPAATGSDPDARSTGRSIWYARDGEREKILRAGEGGPLSWPIATFRENRIVIPEVINWLGVWLFVTATTLVVTFSLAAGRALLRRRRKRQNLLMRDHLNRILR